MSNLLRESDIMDKLSNTKICGFIKDKETEKKLILFDETDSTNNQLKKLALDGAKDKTVVIANSQTAGRGRFGKSFFSPENTGIYLSIFRKLDLDENELSYVTPAAAVCVAEVLEEATDTEIGIKWVNDLYYNQKKISGILTETVSNIETGSIIGVVIGVGINLNTVFPDDLQSIAGNLPVVNNPDLRNLICGELINSLSKIEDYIKNKSFIEKYRQKSVLSGKKVFIPTENDEIYNVCCIDEECGLVLENSKGERRVLRNGEVSIKLK